MKETWEQLHNLLEQHYLEDYHIPKEFLETMYNDLGLSLSDIAYVLDTTVAQIFNHMTYHGIPRRLPGSGKTHNITNLPKFTEFHYGIGKHPLLTRTGRYVGSNGYAKIYVPDNPMADKNGEAYEHRLVMSEVLGRPLLSSEHVHHRDGDKLNNSPKNLETVSPSDHTSKPHEIANKFMVEHKPSIEGIDDRWLDIVSEVYDLFCKKNEDYGPSSIAALGPQGVVIRLFDKYSRIKTLLFSQKEESVLDESLEDSVMDLIDYGVILLLLLRGDWPEYVEADVETGVHYCSMCGTALGFD